MRTGLAPGSKVPVDVVVVAVAGTVVGSVVGASVGTFSGLAGRWSSAPSRTAETAKTIAAPRTTIVPRTQASGTLERTRTFMIFPINAPKPV